MFNRKRRGLGAICTQSLVRKEVEIQIRGRRESTGRQYILGTKHCSKGG